MISKIKKDRQPKKNKLNFLQRLYAKKRIFYHLIQFIGNLVSIVEEKIEVRQEFRNIFYWMNQWGDTYYTLTTGYRNYALEDFIQHRMKLKTLELLKKEKNQKKLAYELLTFTGPEFLAFWQENLKTDKSWLSDTDKEAIREHETFYVIKRLW